MEIRSTTLPDVKLVVPSPHVDKRGYFSRTTDTATLKRAGIDPTAFVQDSQSRSKRGVVRGLHGRTGTGEAKLVRCSFGAIFDVVVDARPDSPAFGRWEAFHLDDETLCSLYIPRALLHGFQALTDIADTCYRIDAEHNPAEDIAVRYDDPRLAIAWPQPVSLLSQRDATAPGWTQTQQHLPGAG
jgi:dTDP-4-dehydrorhamnose 3,5-epimerase